MLRQTLLVLILATALAACKKGPDKADKNASALSDAPVLISAEDLLTIRNNGLASGPVITGSVQPERRADLRAEVSAVVLQVLKENGEAVKRGDVLVRLDDTAIRDAMTSADEAARSSGQAFDQAEKQFQRMKTLRASGMASAQQLDDAETRRNNAQSDWAAAKARAVQAHQQLQRTAVRAPFDGIVSERKASIGDTVQIGRELVKVIDPTSMRFEGLVSADKVTSVKVGQPVSFRVNGYSDTEFVGKVKRVDPAAHATTRQVEVLVEFADSKQPRVSGLYAEGRIETGGEKTLTIPEGALVRNGDKSFAWRVKGGTLNKISIVIGERDPRRGDYVVRSGLTEGETVLRNPVATLKDGQKVETATDAAAAPTVAASSATAAAKVEK